jgi:hypothetical protein
LKQAEADKKRLELKVTTKKEQLIEARDKLNARDRYLYCNIKKIGTGTYSGSPAQKGTPH